MPTEIPVIWNTDITFFRQATLSIKPIENGTYIHNEIRQRWQSMWRRAQHRQCRGKNIFMQAR
jgi:hypothetical protein